MIIPAKNEEDYIESALHALYNQTDNRGCPLDFSVYEVLVLANNCKDNTTAVVAKFAEQHPQIRLHLLEHNFSSQQANIGRVRRTLMDTAWNRLMSIGKPEGVIASTDADTVVDSNWIYCTLKAVEEGADAVGGRILTSAQTSGHRLYHLQDVTYRHLQACLESRVDPNPYDPWPRHFQNFGPSLAVTASTYERAGRLPVVPHLEDVKFYEAMQRCDVRIRHCPKVRVTTSSRLEGRVGFGFSKQLETWGMMRQQQLAFQVPCADEWLFRFTLQRQLREAWCQQSYPKLLSVAHSSEAPVTRFRDYMVRCTYFGEFLSTVMQSDEMKEFFKRSFTLVSISEAIAQLRLLLQNSKLNPPIQPLPVTSFPKGQFYTVPPGGGTGVLAFQ